MHTKASALDPLKDMASTMNSPGLHSRRATDNDCQPSLKALGKLVYVRSIRYGEVLLAGYWHYSADLEAELRARQKRANPACCK